MLKITAVSKNKEGITGEASLREIKKGGVYAVYADAVHCVNFDPEEGILTEIRLESDATGILAIIEESPYWTKPVFSDAWEKVPGRSNCVLCKKENGEYTAIVPVVGKEYKTELFGKENVLCSRTYSWYEESAFCDELLFSYIFKAYNSIL